MGYEGAIWDMGLGYGIWGWDMGYGIWDMGDGQSHTQIPTPYSN